MAFTMSQKELGVLLTPPTGKQRADEWRGLEIVRQLQIKFEDAERYYWLIAILMALVFTVDFSSQSCQGCQICFMLLDSG